MKTLIYLFVFAMILFAGCAKDEMFDQNSNNPELKKAKVPIPMKVDFCMTPNGEFFPITNWPPEWGPGFVSAGGSISGNATHMGKVDAEKSWGQTTECYFDFQLMQIVMKNTGQITAANGDSYWYDGVSYINLDFTFTGTVTMRDGTGKYEDAQGKVEMVGSADMATMQTCWTAEGSMTFNK